MHRTIVGKCATADCLHCHCIHSLWSHSHRHTPAHSRTPRCMCFWLGVCVFRMCVCVCVRAKCLFIVNELFSRLAPNTAPSSVSPARARAREQAHAIVVRLRSPPTPNANSNTQTHTSALADMRVGGGRQRSSGGRCVRKARCALFGGCRRGMHKRRKPPPLWYCRTCSNIVS